MEILPNSPLLHVLIAWDNIADVKSAGPCSKECSKEISRFSLGDSFMVDIFEESYYKGTLAYDRLTDSKDFEKLIILF